MAQGKRRLGLVFAGNVSRTVTLLLILIAIVHAASAQEPAPPRDATVLSVTTQLVTLDVTVNDKAGLPVLDLGKDEFRITENKEPQRVRYFEPPSAHRMPSAGDLVHSSADLHKIGEAPVTILVLDEINTPFTNMALARSALERYLKSQPDVLAEPTALFFVDKNKLDVIHDYTQSRAELQQSLKKHFPDYPWQLTVNQGDMGMLPRMSQSLTALLQISEASRGIQGRKNVVWVGAGFPSVDITNAQPDAVKVITDAIRKTTFALLQSKISVFTIDPAYLDPTMVVDQESDSAMAAGDLNSTGLIFGGALQFSSFAGYTGGHAFSMNNHMEEEIASSVSDGANYYELSYAPTTVSQDAARYRKILVSVARPGMTVIARDGYFPAGTASSEADTPSKAEVVGDIQFDLSTAAMSKLTYKGLDITAQPSRTGAYAVSIDAAGISWKDGPAGHFAELSMIAVCFSEKDKPLFKASSEHTARTTGDITKVSGPITYTLPITPPAGTRRIRFVVRDLTSGKVGSVDLKLP